jgi:ribosomal protein S18 acetylase RimI-like enzyme
VRIRPFERDDTARVVALWAACGLTRPWNDPHRDIERKLAVQPELFLVGVRETDADGGADAAGDASTDDGADALLATVMAGYDGHRGWVNYLAVDPAARGRGHARALMARVEAELTARGCPKLNLQVREGNDEAMAFYRALGYEPDRAVAYGKRLIAD